MRMQRIAATTVVAVVAVSIAVRVQRDARDPASGSSMEAGADAVTQPSRFRFTDVSADAGLTETHSDLGLAAEQAMTSGVAVADVYGTGRYDIYLTRVGKPNSLYRNNGDGTFSDTTSEAGLIGPAPGEGSSAPVFADFDADGCPDLFVTAARRGRRALFMNDCHGRFIDETQARGLAVAAPTDGQDAHEHGAAVSDYDLDGDLDLLVLRWDPLSYATASSTERACGSADHMISEPAKPSRSGLFRNDGTGHFTEVSDETGLSLDGLHAFTGQFLDMVGDDFPDLAVTGDFCTSRLFENVGGTRFRDVTGSASVGIDENGMGSVVADIDGNGTADWFVTSIWFPTPPGLRDSSKLGWTGNKLYLNQGDGSFEEKAQAAGLEAGWWGWGAAIEDFDHDGHLDVVQTNGFDDSVTSAERNPAFSAFVNDPMRYWRGSPGLRFTEMAADVGLRDVGVGHALVSFDFDGDGDLDLLIARSNKTPLLYRNDLESDSSWLRVRLVDETTPGNRSGIGAKVEIRTRLRTITGWIDTSGSYESQKPAEMHAAITPRDTVLEVAVWWPGADSPQVIKQPPVDRVLSIQRSPG